MRKILFFFLLINCFYSNAYSVSYSSDPKLFVTELVEDAIKILSDKSTTKEQKASSIEEIAINNVDVKGLGLYTLGELRKKINSNDLNNYQLAFEKYFLKSLTSRLSDSEQKSSNYTIVKSKIIESASQPEIKISWRIYTKNPDKPLIRDLIVEGLSLARTQKEEFASILNSNNNEIQALINKLNEFVKK
jgi:phospholipid transport system substrate-binding protein